ncbi:MAG: UvrD-helicase domain-containing protein, partial [Gammaproteobacteria bacterium]|nr:UvrD-helicase domain-containing protein [Gammaproteobacteria bacterium]
MTGSLEPPDARQRDEALDATRSFIVQAPAGSGKTELLIQRYLRLLACVQEPEEVLAVTFTRKAAGEMRSRIISALNDAASPDPPSEPHLRRSWGLARDILADDARRSWQLPRHPA